MAFARRIRTIRSARGSFDSPARARASRRPGRVGTSMRAHGPAPPAARDDASASFKVALFGVTEELARAFAEDLSPLGPRGALAVSLAAQHHRCPPA